MVLIEQGFRHAVDAAEITAVRYRYPQIPQRPGEAVLEQSGRHLELSGDVGNHASVGRGRCGPAIGEGNDA